MSKVIHLTQTFVTIPLSLPGPERGTGEIEPEQPAKTRAGSSRSDRGNEEGNVPSEPG
jgi:hypothetical protein